MNIIYERFYSLDIPLTVWYILGAMVICMAIAGALLWPRLRRVRRQVSEDDEAPVPDEGYPSVSVIVYSQASGATCALFFPRYCSRIILPRSK